MIIVTVHLHSANTGNMQELGRIHIANDGTGTLNCRNYDGRSYIGRDKESLDRGRISKIGVLKGFHSERYHIWNLVRAMLTSLGYTQGQ